MGRYPDREAPSIKKTTKKTAAKASAAANSAEPVLLSGGLDSMVAAGLARERGFALQALTIDYGQRHVRELQSAEAIAAKLGAERHVVLPIDLRRFGGSALTDPSLAVPKDGVAVTHSSWGSEDEAWLDVTQRLRAMVENAAEAVVVDASQLVHLPGEAAGAVGMPAGHPRFLPIDLTRTSHCRGSVCREGDTPCGREPVEISA